MDQMNMFDLLPEGESIKSSNSLQVVKSKFIEQKMMTWTDLFTGYDELYVITFSSGMQFTRNLLERFIYSEVIYGCEDIVDSSIAAIMAVEAKLVELITKSKNAFELAKMMEQGSLKLYVSRDLKSHEKIFLLKSKDGKVRVVTGSANMSSSAFCGYQRENITYYDDQEAFDYYYIRFVEFRETCSDNVNHNVVNRMINGEEELLREVPEEIPIMQTLKAKTIVVIEEKKEENEFDEYELVSDIKGFQEELKPMLPRAQKDGKILLTTDNVQPFRHKYKEHREVKAVREKRLPKLNIDYQTKSVRFNGKECNLNPDSGMIAKDIECVNNYLFSLSKFYGDVEQSQKDYFLFMNWYMASIFMPYLRYIAFSNNYDVTPFPVVGIIYGDSNGGKSTFVRLLSKLMCGKKIPLNSSDDFTSSNIEKLKRACEGIPINIDDLAKQQYQSHCEKVIKDDEWGIRDHFLNYPAIAITTNKLPAVSADISKRAIVCRIDTKIDKEDGIKNSKKFNEGMKNASNSMYCEYLRRMLVEIEDMVTNMKTETDEYFPDVFEKSSKILVDIFKEYRNEELPEYIRCLTYADYFGNKAVGRNAIQKIITAWKTEPEQFERNKKKNKLVYSYPEGGRTYELKYIFEELPPMLNAQLASRSITMDLDKAQEFFEVEFKKKGWFR